MIESAFAAMWFSWAGTHAPAWLSPYLVAGAVLGVLLAVLGALLARRGAAAGSPLADSAVRHRYDVVAAAGAVLVLVGVTVLGSLGADEYVAAWFAAVVGIHFVPLGRAFGEPLLYLSGVLITAVALLAAVVVALRGGDTSTIAATGTGLLLLLTAVPTLLGTRVPARAR
ncbi:MULTISPECIES: hypothetical protein [Catenuloplanes]|uniref:Uncharacterized protein n=1 Tax=Catenuloplanes niger TaxID=587534 RepID=A0AAE4CUW9_9ACTN|nr:hypothetical protein [Catenuloplanes niger]MDR7326801.1 hypothetical protein [Catenuloplanes niger]